MPTRRQYLGSTFTLGVMAIAGCTGGRNLPDSVEPASSGWGLPQGTAAGTRTNPTTDYITANLRSVAQFSVDEESDVGETINATIPDREGVLLFSDNSVTQTAWGGSENWQYETEGAVLTGALIQNVVVVVLSDKVIGLQYGTGEVSWEITTTAIEGEGFSSTPTLTGYITAVDGHSLGGAENGVCIGTEDETGLIVINAVTGSLTQSYVPDGTSVLESNPAYDRGNDVLVLATSSEIVGLDGQTLEEEFTFESGLSEDLFTHYGLSIVHAGAGSIMAVDTTIEQSYENDIESDAAENRVQWTTTDVNSVRAPPTRVGSQAIFPTETGVEAVSINAGQVTWRAEQLGACDAVASSKGHLYALTSQGRVYVLDGLTGDVITDYFVEGEWDDLVVWGEYILLTGKNDGVIVLEGDESRDGLEPLIDVLQQDIMPDRLTFTDNQELRELTDDPIDSLDDVPGSDIDGLVRDIVQQYENGEIPYIRARNMLERMMYYFETLDLALEFTQRNVEDGGVEPFTVGDNRPIREDSLALLPEMEYFGEQGLDEYNNRDVALSLLYSRRAARAIFDTISSLPGSGTLKSPQAVWDIITSEFAEIGDDFFNVLFEILTGSGISGAEDYINEKLEQDLIPQWLANVLFTWITNTLVPIAVPVYPDSESGEVRVVRPNIINDVIDDLIDAMAHAWAQKQEYSVQISRENITTEYTDLVDKDYGFELEDDEDENENDDIDETKKLIRDNFHNLYEGVTAADVPRNVTESDLFDNLDRIDSLPGNQTQAAASSIALQRLLAQETQDTLRVVYPYDFVDTAVERAGDAGVVGAKTIENVGTEILGVDEDVEIEDSFYEFTIRSSLRIGQGAADVLGPSGWANLTHTVSNMYRLRGALNVTMTLISDQGSHDILFGVNESDPGHETLLSQPFPGERTAFEDYSEEFEDRIEEENEAQDDDDEDGESETQSE